MEVVSYINDIVWSPPLIFLLLGAGIYFTIRTRFVQVRRFGLMVKLLSGGGDTRNVKDGKALSPFQAFCLALSGRVGTGNIMGVATAIAFGGPGSVFWMWIVAFLGASTAYAESTLAQMYKFRHNGGFRGGPATYIEKGLKLPWLGVLFAISTIIGYGLLLLLIQANGVSSAFANTFHFNRLITGIVLAAVIGLVVVGGLKRIGKVAVTVTPAMAVIYILMALVIIAVNIEKVPGVFKLIFQNAFAVNPLVGGILGTTVMVGIKRGLFSNEAGEGGGAIVSASADNSMPARQGLVQAFSVYIDTLLVCTATALMILCTDSYNILSSDSGQILHSVNPQVGTDYTAYTQTAIDTVFHGFGSGFVAVALFFFAFTTLMALTFYAESSIEYLFSKCTKAHPKIEKAVTYLYYACVLGLIVFGAVSSSDLIWSMADIGVGLTTWINVIALLILFPQALNALKEFERVFPPHRKNK